MSFFSKALSVVGIGAAKIDAVLDSDSIEPGSSITGVLNIEGGKVEQKINKIDLDVYCNYFIEEEYEEDGETHTRIVERTCRINSLDLAESFTIEAKAQHSLAFELPLCEQAPLSLGQSKTWLQTNLDIDFALDKKDKDYLHVIPTPLQQAVFDSLSALGFDLVEAESEGCSNAKGELPFIQEFEFKAHRGEFADKLDELELVMMNYGNEVGVHLEIDRRARGVGGFFAEMFGRDEVNAYLSVTADNLESLSEQLYQLIDENC